MTETPDLKLSFYVWLFCTNITKNVGLEEKEEKNLFSMTI